MKHHEENIIGGLLKGVVKSADVNLSLLDFPNYATPYRIIREIETEGLTPDVESVYQRSLDTPDYFTLEDFERFARLPLSASTCFSSAKILRQKSLKQDLFEQTNILLGKSEKMSGAEYLQNLKRIIADAESGYSEVKDGFKSLADIAPSLAKVYDDLHQGISFAVPTYFERIDDTILDGFSRGDLHIIVGFTGAGKSSLMLSFAVAQVLQNHRVGLVSREMSDEENVMRLQTSIAKVPRWCIRKNMSIDDYNRLIKNLDQIKDLPLEINSSTVNVEDLRPQVKMAVESRGLEILYVDYLQLMKSSGSHASRANEVQTVSRTLKEIGMENNIPVVGLCQFNRGAVNTGIYEIMYQLKESSGLEQDASTILYVQVEKTQEFKRTKTATVTVLKNRNGTPFSEIAMEFEGEFFKFQEPSREYSNYVDREAN